MDVHQQGLKDEMIDWLKSEVKLLSYLPYNYGWTILLDGLTTTQHKITTTQPMELENHLDFDAYQKIAARLKSRNSRLIPLRTGEYGFEPIIPEDDGDSGEIQTRFNGYRVQTFGQDIVVDGARIDRGPLTLLFRMMLDRKMQSPVLRFLNLRNQIEGVSIRNATRNTEQGREILRDGRFNLCGLPNAPRAEPRRVAERPPPPMCDWNHETYLLGIELGDSSTRRVIPLPSSPATLERFLTIWNGRPSTTVSDRLRACVLHIIRILGTPASDARITPHERSFELLRSVVEGNKDVLITRRGLLVKGKLGVTWRISPGQGAHDAPYLIHATTGDEFTRGPPICIYDNAELPLGDRLTSVVLGLLNDNQLIHQFSQIAEAVKLAKSLKGKN